MDFVSRFLSNYVHNKMSLDEAKSVILGSYAILASDFRSDEQKVKMIEDIYKKVFFNQTQK
ncbi:hypothetical protein M3196_00295 [Fictibacillus nanhaiensis]|uniref:hypothetical protein n=1 Tax=Fictibacillus nanhaiensis TaxID=742169 RepID=UPI00203DCB6C|nr:hypothetical protein [Fictibacillus nanhaiensis]MCM3730107.1 hypothetical protein [Fictibacillus nanhaiensis]